jgi:hypothetical protein
MAMKRQMVRIAAILALCLWANHYALAQNDHSGAANANPEAVRSATVITIHGKIAGLDKATKQITLEAPVGRKVNLVVENPNNLENVKVEDPVVVRYYEVVTVRKKKPDEAVPSLSVREGIATAMPGGAPGAIAEQKVSIRVAVAAIDKADGTVTIKAPDGTTETVKAVNPQNLNRIKVGDDLIVTLKRATALAVAKE